MRTPIALFFLGVLFATTFRAPAAPTTEPTTAKIDIHHLIVHPAPMTRPVMKYVFITPAIDRTHGNAATLYLLAAEITPRDSTVGPTTRSVEDRIDDYLDMSGEQLSKSDVADFLTKTAPLLRLLDLAAAREECRWDFPRPARGADDIALEMTQLSSMRYLVNLLSIRMKFEMAQHHYDETVHTMRSGFAMAENLAPRALLIQALVSAGIAEIVLQRGVEELQQSPGSPNLYWALADLPRPFIGMRDVLQNEEQQIKASHAADGFIQSQYKEAWDQIYAAFLLPYPQAFAALQRLQHTSNSVGQILIPSITGPGMTMAMIDRDIAIYQCIEAIRAYAADHQGKPPQTLAEMVETPAPPDPMTGKPFVYTVAGQSFTLDAPSPNGQPRFGRRMEVVMMRD